MNFARQLCIHERALLPQSSFDNIASVLNICTCEADVSNFTKLQAYIRRIGADSYPALGDRLIHDRPDDDIQITTSRNGSFWNDVIFGYIKAAKPHLAFKLFEKLYKDNLPVSTTLALIKACTKSKDLVTGCRIHNMAEKVGLLSTSVFIGSALVDMYAKCGSLMKAQGIFDRLPFRDAISWTSLIAGYVEHGQGKEALCCFDEMQLEGIRPDLVTFFCVLRACAAVRDTEKGIEMHAAIERYGFLKKSIVLGSTLVHMYSKCGLLERAQDVFDNLPTRDVITWNALILGYVECGCANEALKCFEQMQVRAVAPNVATFISVLKACSDTRNLTKGLEVHVDIDKYEFLETNPLVGSSLIEMYSKCGCLSKAQDLFDGLSIRNVVAWTTLIAGYVEYGYGTEALNCYEQMHIERVHPSAITYVCILKACGILGALHKGCEIHREITNEKALESNLFIGSSLVDMYIKCGCFAKAQEVFDKVPIKDRVLWNALIGGYAEHGYGKEALRCLEKMQTLRVSPDAVTLISGLKACASVGAIDEGNHLYDEIKRQGLLGRNNLFGSALIDMHAKCGKLAKAKEIFDKLPVQDIVSWNALIAGYTEHENNEEAIKCFEEMQCKGVSPDSVTFICCLKVCGKVGAMDKVREVHAEIKRQGLIRDIVVGNALLDAYVKCGLITEGRKIFDKHLVRDVVSWTTLIAGYTEKGYHKQALELFEQMQRDGVSPNAVTIACSLKACGGIKAGNKVKEIHLEIKRLRLLEKDPVIGNTLVDIYAKCGLIADAQEVFDTIQGQDIKAWTALISGYVHAGNGKEALKCFEQMQFEGVCADSLTYIGGLKACGMVGAIDKGEEMHAGIERQGLLAEDFVLGNALVDMYAKCGHLAKAQDVFGKLPVRNVVTWTALMAGYVQHGESNNVFNIFDMMLEEGIHPDPVSFVVVLSACSRVGQLGLMGRIQTYFEIMSRTYGIIPAIEHHTCVINLFSRAGQVEEAVNMINKIQLPDNSIGIWHAVLTSCANLGNIQFGRHAFDFVKRLSG